MTDAEQRPAALDTSAEQLERFRPGLLLMAVRRLGSSEAAEEAVQETLARALVALNEGRLAESNHLAAFVTGIARHVIVDWHRSQGRVLPLEVLPEKHHLHPDPNALDGLVTAEEHARVRAALSHLRDTDRDLLRLCYFEGLTPNEIAVRLGEPAERVRQRKSRALERLRAAFHNARRVNGHESRVDATTVKEEP